jgi:hypothetical protein
MWQIARKTINFPSAEHHDGKWVSLANFGTSATTRVQREQEMGNGEARDDEREQVPLLRVEPGKHLGLAPLASAAGGREGERGNAIRRTARRRARPAPAARRQCVTRGTRTSRRIDAWNGEGVRPAAAVSRSRAQTGEFGGKRGALT